MIPDQRRMNYTSQQDRSFNDSLDVRQVPIYDEFTAPVHNSGKSFNFPIDSVGMPKRVRGVKYIFDNINANSAPDEVPNDHS